MPRCARRNRGRWPAGAVWLRVPGRNALAGGPLGDRAAARGPRRAPAAAQAVAWYQDRQPTRIQRPAIGLAPPGGSTQVGHPARRRPGRRAYAAPFLASELPAVV